MTLSPTLMSSGMRSSPSSLNRPGPTARTSPSWGFSLAVSGMTSPEAVVDVQISKVLGVAKREGLDTLLLGGGVAANSRLRARLAAEAEDLGLRLLVPSPALCTDNGAMVACAGSHALERGERTPLDVGADPNLHIIPGFGRRAPRRPRRRHRDG